MMLETLFWSACFLIVYTYVGYPLLTLALSLLVDNKVKVGDYQPFVSIIISAYNEERDIEEKLRNTRMLDYPMDKLEIIVASDGSTDNTDRIVKQFALSNPSPQLILHRVEGRLGKTAAQNSAVRIARGEIVVFSDAASLYDAGAVKAIVKNYADPTVGAVSGRYSYINRKGASVGFATILFWNIENFIKSRQTRIKTVTGCCGCIYSVRKKLYTELPPAIISDLVEPLTILKKGYRIVFESKAQAVEETTEKPKQEFKMRIRVIVRGMNGLLYMRTLLNPLKYPFVSFQLLSHKVLRWLVPVFCIVIFFTSSALAASSMMFMSLLILQCLFYLFALLGILLEKRGFRWKVLSLPMYFTIVNAASLVSLFKVFKGDNIVVWQTQR